MATPRHACPPCSVRLMSDQKDITLDRILKHIEVLRDQGVEVFVDQERLESKDWMRVVIRQKKLDEAVIVIDGDTPP